ncbi:MAG: hypothetical protein M1402_02880 [Candidatus Thermoplasmatota archaeon]|nr:hypothetical protein [Candidatus Thermoplasmatota archaeon]
MRWKQFLRLTIISVAFIVLFSSLWYYSGYHNSPVKVETPIYLNFYNNTFSDNIPLSLHVTEQIVSYGNGGAISYYDGISINGTVKPAADDYAVYVNSSSSSIRIVVNNLSYGSSGNLKLSLKPGFYNVTAVFEMNISVGRGTNVFSIFSEMRTNISGNFITILVRPDSTVYIYPFAASIFAAALFTGISLLEMRRFNRNFMRK